jgi:hypothetical protein
MDTVALTYDEIAERWSITGPSARNLARRRRWARAVGNDGRARISVPIEALPETPSEGTPEAPSEAPPEAPPITPSVEIRLARTEATLDALREIVTSERRRADAAEADRDRWHELAMRPWWRRLAG